jgi:CubicO group peptidase (beta-lactamase class C family)
MTVSRRIPPLAIAALAFLLAAVPARALQSLDAKLSPYLDSHGLPALAAAVAVRGEIVAAGAVGARRAGTDIPVTLADKFHIGSDTKAMTALLAAMLAEEGRLAWNSTPASIFPELARDMDAGFAAVTLDRLLSHSAGVPPDGPELGELLDQAAKQDGNLDQLRRFIVAQAGRKPLAFAPGTRFAYSNLGYMTAGAMIERAGGKTWEELIVERVFAPLGLATAGLGCQASLGRVDAPLGHLLAGGKPEPVLAGINCDNPDFMGPAGVAHMSILDFARWAAWNAGEGARGPALVKPETLRKLHAPVIGVPDGQNAAPGTKKPEDLYALGWGVVTVDFIPHPVLQHGGSNMKNLAHIWVDPERDFAVVLATNIAGEKANEALIRMARDLFAVYAPTPGK